MNVPIKFHPIYQERVWGGRKLQKKMGRILPDGKKIGESWEIVDRPEAQSIVAEGPLHGLSLRALIEGYGNELMGPGYDTRRLFPILVKWLDCRERLSLQVHPPQEAASMFGGEPKTENWYIAEAAADATVFVGLRQGVTGDKFKALLQSEELESPIHRVGVRAGDSILIPSGRIHAIGGGNVILEIQQNSDTTYRVYDWGRVGLDGSPRPLHIEQSLRSIDFCDFEPEPLRADSRDQMLADCREFRIRKLHLKSTGERLSFARGEEPRLLHILEGHLCSREGGPVLRSGENFLLPYAGEFTFEASEPTVVLITDRFTRQ